MKKYSISTREYLQFLTKYSNQQFKYTTHTGDRMIPLMVEGVHGIGKTQITSQFAKNNNLPVVVVAAGQLSEVGDLTGIPKLSETGYTVCMPPQFLFRLRTEIAKSLGKTAAELTPAEYENTPCILVFDDITRTNGTVLNGLMQLFQDGAMLDWSLPKKCLLIATCNPEDTQSSSEDDTQFFYSVESLDPAQKTRFNWVKVESSLSATSMYLCQKYGVETLGVFLQQDELQTLMKTVSPRQIGNWMTMCYDSWVVIDQVNAEQTSVKNKEVAFEDIKLAAAVATNPQFVAAVSAFAARGTVFPQILPYLFSQDVNGEKVLAQITDLAVKNALDFKLWSAFVATLIADHELIWSKVDSSNVSLFKERMIAFLKLPQLDNQTRLAMAQTITANPDPQVKTILADPELGRLLLKKI